MADYIDDVSKETSKLDWVFPFQRTGAFPLDRSTLFSTFQDAQAYAKGEEDVRGLSGTSYVGQIISVLSNDTKFIDCYVITPNRELEQIGDRNALSVEYLPDSKTLIFKSNAISNKVPGEQAPEISEDFDDGGQLDI